MGIDLFESADLAEADLRNACLTGANLAGARRLKSDLIHADLRGASLERADVEARSSTHTNLHNFFTRFPLQLDTIWLSIRPNEIGRCA